ncbi:hypothetical protein Cni_G09375 [Canna indica]|uniref:Uncharacterized protein n=1 Tax=Canna indica TaxID=4628 RepID=A0AAQ3K5I6_9LILI|nr:hypothetical protein Cni_G09375 [Canna indica]
MGRGGIHRAQQTQRAAHAAATPPDNMRRSDHDRASGEGVQPQDYVLVKMEVLPSFTSKLKILDGCFEPCISEAITGSREANCLVELSGYDLIGLPLRSPLAIGLLKQSFSVTHAIASHKHGSTPVPVGAPPNPLQGYGTDDEKIMKLRAERGAGWTIELSKRRTIEEAFNSIWISMQSINIVQLTYASETLDFPSCNI